ncbi:unnamed protein product [Brachionus calyciflorus]|uniref:Uncharacterized protein n=1 Tax=Brachionus calyciflorus TaxID=104777 RepID=A0A814BK89_9BILA|nr:unnamed protein product [Brachionus calyciflorus]
MNETPKYIGSINEFDPNDFLCPELISKLFFSFDRIILTSFPTETHGNLVEIISDSTRKGFERKFHGKIRPRGSSDISLVNLRECCHEFKKSPDDSISIIHSYLDGRSDPFLVIEIEYAIMVQFSKVPEGNESIRKIVAQRSDSNPIVFYDSSDERETKEHQIIKEHSFKCKGSESKFLSSRNHEKDPKKFLTKGSSRL